MNNRELEERNKNQEKERRQTDLYEIPDATDDLTHIISFKNENITLEIVNMLLERSMSYLEMNEVLYQADKALRNKMLKAKLGF